MKPRAAVTAMRFSQTFFLMRARPSCVGTAHHRRADKKKAGERSARHDGPRLRASLGAFDRPGRAVTTSAASRSPVLSGSTFGTLDGFAFGGQRLSPARNELLQPGLAGARGPRRPLVGVDGRNPRAGLARLPPGEGRHPVAHPLRRAQRRPADSSRPRREPGRRACRAGSWPEATQPCTRATRSAAPTTASPTVASRPARDRGSASRTSASGKDAARARPSASARSSPGRTARARATTSRSERDCARGHRPGAARASARAKARTSRSALPRRPSPTRRRQQHPGGQQRLGERRRRQQHPGGRRRGPRRVADEQGHRGKSEGQREEPLALSPRRERAGPGRGGEADDGAERRDPRRGPRGVQREEADEQQAGRGHDDEQERRGRVEAGEVRHVGGQRRERRGVGADRGERKQGLGRRRDAVAPHAAAARSSSGRRGAGPVRGARAAAARGARARRPPPGATGRSWRAVAAGPAAPAAEALAAAASRGAGGPRASAAGAAGRAGRRPAGPPRERGRARRRERRPPGAERPERERQRGHRRPRRAHDERPGQKSEKGEGQEPGGERGHRR